LIVIGGGLDKNTGKERIAKQRMACAVCNIRMQIGRQIGKQRAQEQESQSKDASKECHDWRPGKPASSKFMNIELAYSR
jgi:hypothetical protein